MNGVEGRVVLVTGGGRGLGAQTCFLLAGAGAMVLPADIRADLADQVAREIVMTGGKAESLRLDVTDPEQAENAVSRTVERYGRLDVLVNNAAIDVSEAIDEIALNDWNRILDVNLRGPFLMSRFALIAMKKQTGPRHIVNVVSTAAKRAWANASGYHASKWGLLGFSHALHVEARQAGIKVTAVLSGGMRTPFLLERFPGIDVGTLQDPRNVADTIRYVLTQPDETVIPEMMVIPMKETSWP